MKTANDSQLAVTTRPQDSVLQAVALIQKQTQKADAQNALTTTIAANVTNIVTVPSTVPTATTSGPFGHDITTMSDNDLISYINPSCFDQGKQRPFSFFLIFIAFIDTLNIITV